MTAKGRKIMLEDYLIEYCSPTLAALKPANLFNYEFTSCEELEGQLAEWNKKLSDKGIAITVLRRNEKTALVYVYRPSRLRRELERSDVCAFLKGCGYSRFDVTHALECLRSHLALNDVFPHEIGVFLGYPLDDVKAFICNGGRNCKCVGCWKVYGNEKEAAQTFARFKKCSSIYSKLWNGGRSVRQLTVAV